MIEAKDAPIHRYPPHTESAVVDFRQRVKREFSQDDATRTENALQLMLEVHVGQPDRPNGAPYVEHPLQVASFVLDAMEYEDPDVVIAALLHDTIEDQAGKLAAKDGTSSGLSEQELAFAYIQKKFGNRVRDIVSGLTNPDFETMLEQNNKPYTQENKNGLYLSHVVEAIQDPDVALIKYGDFSSNAFHLDQVVDHARREKLTRKYLPVFPYFIERFENENNPINLRPEMQSEILSNLRKMQHILQSSLDSQP